MTKGSEVGTGKGFFSALSKALPVLLAILLLSTTWLGAGLPAFASWGGHDQKRGPGLTDALRQQLVNARLGNQADLVVNLLTKKGEGTSLERAILSAGGRILRRTGDLITFRAAPDLVEGLAADPRVTIMGADGPAGIGQAAGRAESPTAVGQAAAAGFQGSPDPSAFHLNLKAMHLPELRSLVQATGQGNTIAVIDTGADPSRPELLWGMDGQRKIVDWIDLTGEGDVDTRSVATARWGKISTSLGEVKVAGIHSASGRYHYGVFREEQIARNSPLAQDINRNGRSDDRFLVLVVDSSRPGVYDTVYVDTNQDLNLADEIPMQVFRDHLTVAWFGIDRPGTPTVEESAFMVTSISADGNLANLGFDGNGHGTHVAGLAAGSAAAAGREGGGLSGTAPAARLMVLKALNSGGEGSWQSIFHAVTYAAEKGARVLSVSIAGLINESDLDSFPARLLEELGARYDAIIVLAAGNNGPGLGTAVAPGGNGHTLVVGAYLSRDLWKGYFGYDIPQDTIWYFSSVGPRRDGGLSPDLVAPGAAVSCLPRWLSPSGYGILEGTSMAVPQVAGAVADLLEAGSRWAVPMSAARIKRALWAGASPLPGYEVIEQGFGALDVNASWLKAIWLTDFPILDAGPYQPDGGSSGLLAGDFIPGKIPFRIQNPADRQINLELKAEAAWLWPDRPSLVLSARGSRVFNLGYGVPAGPGLYSSLLSLRAPGEEAPLGASPSLILRPYTFGTENGWSVQTEGSLRPALFRRYLLRIPEGTTALLTRLAVPVQGGFPRGRVRLQLFRPDGQAETMTGYIGAGVEGGSDLTLQVQRPQPGNWQAIVYSAEDLSTYNLTESRFQFTARVHGVFADKAPLHLTLVDGHTAYPEAGSGLLSTDQGDTAFLSFQLTSVGEGFPGRVTGVGLFPEKPEAKSESITVSRQEAIVRNLPEVTPSTVLLEVEASPASDPEANLDLYLFRLNPQTRQWEKVAASTQEKPGKERVEVFAPTPGQYVAYVEARSLTWETTSFQLSYRIVNDNGQIAVEKADRTFTPGQTEQFRLKVSVPPQAGDYFGYLMVTEAGKRERLTLFPLVVEKDKPKLLVQALPQRAPTAGLWGVILNLFDQRSWSRAAGRVEINGLVYDLPGGRITFPPEAAAEQEGILTTGGLYGTRYVRYHLPRPVDWGVLNPTTGRENSILRSKVLSELGKGQ
ncbi:MAG: S8 family serine peptidase [Firmicutes bacterium]|nr:S8 family serine peptidase [Bacillota bacterium]MCL5039574.1 S8 family serine peptidase [Bacillota bacterium]